MTNIAVLQESAVAALTLAYSNNLTPGSSLCCAIRNANSGITYTCSDNVNGAWTEISTLSDSGGNNHASATFKFDGNTSSGKPTVTVVATGGAGSPVLYIAEIGNTSGFDTSAAADQNNKGTGADAFKTPNATPSAQPGLIWSIGIRAAGTGTLSAGTGFTTGNTSFSSNLTQNKRYTSTAAAAATMTDSVGTDDVLMFGMWFKETTTPPIDTLLGQGWV